MKIIELLPNLLSLIALLILAGTLVNNIKIISMLGKAVLKSAFYFFLISILIYAATIVFVLTVESGFLKVGELSFHVWWHLLYCLSMGAFIWGGEKLKAISKADHPSGENTLDKVATAGILTLAGLCFVFAQIFNSSIENSYTVQWLDQVGAFHFAAFIAGFVAFISITHIRQSWGLLINKSLAPTLVFLVTTGMLHFWELITETYAILSLGHNAIEVVEGFILIVATLSAYKAFLGILRGLS